MMAGADLVFGGLRSPEASILRQGIPESIFSGSMPLYKCPYSPGKSQTSPKRGLHQPAHQAIDLVHEALHPFSGWSDSKIFGAFGPYGCTTTNNISTEGISDWIARDCH